jgi:hypothetical protein
MMENMSTMNPMAKMPGFEAMQAQQEAFLKAMTGGFSGNWSGPGREDDDRPRGKSGDKGEDLESIKAELAKLQKKLSDLDG